MAHQYFIKVGFNERGPFTLEQLGTEGITPSTEVKRKGGVVGFVQARYIPEITERYFPSEKPEPSGSDDLLEEETKTSGNSSSQLEDKAEAEANKKLSPTSDTKSVPSSDTKAVTASEFKAVARDAKESQSPSNAVNESKREPSQQRESVVQPLGNSARTSENVARPIGNSVRTKESVAQPLHRSRTYSDTPTAAPSNPPERKEWYLYEDGNRKGPFTLSELRRSRLNTRSYVWRPGMVNWQAASSVKETADAVTPQPMPQPKQQPLNRQPQTQYGSVWIPDGVSAVLNQTHKRQDYSFYEEENRGSRRRRNLYGHPERISMWGMAITFAYMLFAMYLVFLSGLNERLHDVFECRPYVNNFTMRSVAAHDLDFFDGSLYCPVFFSFLVPILLFGSSFYFASKSRKAYERGYYDESFKFNGIAFGCGWGSILYSVAALILSIFVSINSHLWGYYV